MASRNQLGTLLARIAAIAALAATLATGDVTAPRKAYQPATTTKIEKGSF